MKVERIESAEFTKQGHGPSQGLEACHTDGTARSGSTASISIGERVGFSFEHDVIIQRHNELANRTKMKKQERKLAKLTLRKQLKAAKLIPQISKMVVSKAALFEK